MALLQRRADALSAIGAYKAAAADLQTLAKIINSDEMAAKADDLMQQPAYPLDYYVVLRLTPQASQEQVKEAYKQLNSIFDPDLHSVGPPEKVRCVCSQSIVWGVNENNQSLCGKRIFREAAVLELNLSTSVKL